MTHSTISWETMTRKVLWATEPITLSPAIEIDARAHVSGLGRAWTGCSVTSAPTSAWTGRTPIGTISISVTVTAAGSLSQGTTLPLNVQ
jgi:hypothetical protein